MFVAFAELPVSDQHRARAFYAERLGCDVVADAPMGAGAWRWIELGFPGAQTALHFVRRQNEAPSEGPVLVFMVDDLRSTVRELVF
jgi:extradiol dioxygenase family protein